MWPCDHGDLTDQVAFEPGLWKAVEGRVLSVDGCLRGSVLELREGQRPPVPRTCLAPLRNSKEALRAGGLEQEGRGDGRSKLKLRQDPVESCEDILFYPE